MILLLQSASQDSCHKHLSSDWPAKPTAQPCPTSMLALRWKTCPNCLVQNWGPPWGFAFCQTNIAIHMLPPWADFNSQETSQNDSSVQLQQSKPSTTRCPDPPKVQDVLTRNQAVMGEFWGKLITQCLKWPTPTSAPGCVNMSSTWAEGAGGNTTTQSELPTWSKSGSQLLLRSNSRMILNKSMKNNYVREHSSKTHPFVGKVPCSST